jgi:AcrR family transcriptional regulator
MARPIAANHQLQRDQILDTAAACFAQTTYPATSMTDIAKTLGASKAKLYHYYESKEALLFDLLDRYTQRLLLLIAQTEATAQRKGLDDRAAAHELIRNFLTEYENSATRHKSLLNDTLFLGEEQREFILNRQRDVMSATSRFLRRAYPQRFNEKNDAALTMMVFGMMNWTFTWLKADGALSHEALASVVTDLFFGGLPAVRLPAAG